MAYWIIVRMSDTLCTLKYLQNADITGGKICTPNNYEIITTGKMPSRDTQAKNSKK